MGGESAHGNPVILDDVLIGTQGCPVTESPYDRSETVDICLFCYIATDRLYLIIRLD